MNQQLDIHGGRHDIAPAHETQKLFDNAPQINGQTVLATDAWCDQATCPQSECEECKKDTRNALERVRALFPAGAVVECVENTYIPTRAGTRRVVVKPGKSVCECEMDGKPYRMSLPTRVSDVVSVTEDSVTFKLQGYRGPERLAGHTCTFRVLA